MQVRVEMINKKIKVIFQLRHFQELHSSDLGNITGAIEKAQENMKWMHKNYKRISRWLQVQKNEEQLE